MGRVPTLVAALVAAGYGVAAADPTHRVTIDTEPSGAHVYLNDKESGAKCEKTPCTFEAPIGSNTIIIELEKYGPVVEAIDVPKRTRDRKPPVFHYKLSIAVGTIVIDDASARGAVIQIDGKDHGKVPQRIEVEPGGHQVQVKLDGKELFDDFVDVATSAEVPIKLAALKVDSTPPHRNDPNLHADEDVAIEPPKRTTPRDRFIAVSLISDVGFRWVHYDQLGPMPGASTEAESESGQVIGGPAIELWPAELAHLRHLRGLSLYLRAEFPLNHQEVRDSKNNPLGPKTFWQSFEASVRHRWELGVAAAELSGGFVEDELRFNGQDTIIATLPDATYQSFRVGARAFVRLGIFEPFAAFETRFVTSGGALPSRFDTHSAMGYRGAIGIAARSGPFYFRGEASDLHYDWTFSYDGVNDMAQAKSAVDKIVAISLLAGYLY